MSDDAIQRAVPERSVLAEQTRQLYAGLSSILIITCLAVALLTFTHWQHGSRPEMVAWLAAFALSSGLRIALLLAWRRKARDIDDAEPWYRRFFALTVLSALVWGACPWVFFISDSQEHQSLLAFVIAGLGSGAVVSHGARWQVAWVFLLLALIPFAVRFATMDGELAEVTAALVGLYIVALLVISVHWTRRTREHVTARLALSDQFQRSDRQQRRFRSLVESTTAILWEASPDSLEFSYVSPEAEQLLGYPVARWTGEAGFWQRCIHPDDRERAVESCRRATGDMRRHSLDFRMIAADERVVWLRNVVNVVERDGGAERLVGVMMDISELKQTQRELEYVSGLQRLLVETARRLFEAEDDALDHVLTATLERIGQWCAVDRAYLIWFTPDLSHYSNTHEWVAAGVRPEKDNLQNVSSTTIPKLLELLREKQRAVVPDVAALDGSWATEKALFEEQDIRSLISLPIFADEALIGLVGFDSVRHRRSWDDEEVALLQALSDLIGVARERSERRSALEASERLRRHAEALAGMGSWEWEVGSSEFSASVEWRNVTGCGAGRLSSQQVLALTPRPERARVEEALRRTVDDGAPYEVEHRIIRPDTGEPRWVAVHGELVDDEAGRQRLRGFMQDITERKTAQDELFRLAHYDSLTRLPNRVLVLDRLQQALRRARRQQRQVAVLFIDLDQFKKVNDTLGHDAGDRALVDAAERLVALFREQDTVARIGGDEFVVVLDDFDSTGSVTAAASRIIEAFRQPIAASSQEFMLTASIGIALAPHDGASAHDLMRNADTAMYHAKEQGRDGYQFFTRSMNEAVERQIAIEQALRVALEHGELDVRYQPVFRLSDRTCVGAEALARWDHPELGMLSPGEFVPVAEQAGLIAALGDFVLRTVVDRVAEWRRLKPDFRVSINASPRQFRDSAIAETVRRELARAGVEGDALEVEVTEGLLLPEREDTERALASLREQGVGLVMDDFGTGYASLRYLRDHPFSSLKIDRGFIRGLDRDRRNRQLVVSALRLGQALEMKVVAEGIETEAELDVLADAGCELVQGFLFSRPVDAEAVTELLSRCEAG